MLGFYCFALLLNVTCNVYCEIYTSSLALPHSLNSMNQQLVLPSAFWQWQSCLWIVYFH